MLDKVLPRGPNSSTSLLPQEVYKNNRRISCCNKLITCCFYGESDELDGGFSTTKFCIPIITKIALGTMCMTLSGVVFGAAMQIGGGFHTFSILQWYALAGAITGCVGSFFVITLHNCPDPNDY